ncbi:MAG: bifunctional glutamate N-acetyltransferase/amino-acid acetyltransferase ArgJ [Paracoccaceae bacterium]
MSAAVTVSPLAPKSFPHLPEISGARFAIAAAGVKYPGRSDVMLAHLCAGTSIAGVFTTSKTRSAAVLDCQAKLGGECSGTAAILVNSGNANAFTGQAGFDTVQRLTDQVSLSTDVDQSRVFTASTGVIGEPLPDAKITQHLSAMTKALSTDGLPDAAKAIMTTDTYAKGSASSITVDGKPVHIAGIAKGSGMIAPDMATMLVYIFTDAQCPLPDLQAMVTRLNARTFNCITVDSDTSTSDTLLVAATGKSGVDVSNSSEFESALHRVMLDLAHQVVKDGEGATKFVEIEVSGAVSDGQAKQHAMSVANSPLIKTAIAGEDPNWGRVVMAIGKSGAEADRDRLTIRFGDILVAENGWVSPNYSEEQGARYMRGEHLKISIDLGLDQGAATVWTCDLTHGYISINADYRS